MTEVLFGDSEASSMKCAKGSGGIIGPEAVFGDKSRMPEMKKKWTGVPGSPDEVLCLGYMLDIGSIQHPVNSQERKRMMLRMLGSWTDEELEELEELIKLKDPEKPEDLEKLKEPDGAQESDRWLRQEQLERMLQYDKDYARLKELAADGSPIRIWYSKAPYSYCGLCWICQELAKTRAEIYVVDLPDYEIRSRCITVYQGWGDMECERFSDFLDRQKKLTELERMMYAREWREAAERNSMLRAVVNGRLLSVPEEFYDFLILDRMTGRPEKEARIIGDVIGRTQIGAGDWWYAYRIQKMVEEGRIGTAQDSGKECARMIYKK